MFLSAWSGHKESPVPDGDTDVIPVVLTLLRVRKYMNIEDTTCAICLFCTDLWNLDKPTRNY